MFDLFPDVEPLMLDLPLTRRRTPASQRADGRQAADGTALERARDAVGRGLIAIGSSLVLDKHARRRAAGR